MDGWMDGVWSVELVETWIVTKWMWVRTRVRTRTVERWMKMKTNVRTETRGGLMRMARVKEKNVMVMRLRLGQERENKREEI